MDYGPIPAFVNKVLLEHSHTCSFIMTEWYLRKSCILSSIYKSVCLSLAAVTKHHRLSGLNNRNSFLMVLGAGKFNIKVLADSVPWWRLSSWLADAHLCPHGQKWGGEKRETECVFFLVFFPLIKTLTHYRGGPYPHDPPKPSHFPKTPPSNTISVGLGGSTYEIWRDTNIVSTLST